MKKYFIDKILPALITALVVAAVNTYIDVQMLKKEMQLLRGELSDLWVQANDQIQARK